MSDTATEAALAQPEEGGSADIEVMRALYDPDLDFRKLALETKYRTQGFRLVDKSQLVGVPFIILAVTYRQGFPLNKEKTAYGDYISCEAIVADPATMGSAQVRSQLKGDLTVFPNEPVVFNDGGTGVRRSVTEFLDRIGVIDVGGKTHADDMVYDRPYEMWAEGAELALDGIKADDQGEPLRYLSVRGLRVSEYEYEGQPARTYYFG